MRSFTNAFAAVPYEINEKKLCKLVILHKGIKMTDGITLHTEHLRLESGWEARDITR